MDLDSYILREIGAISRSIQAINDNMFKQYGLQKGQFVFLTRICENRGVNQMELTNILMVDKTTTAKAIQKMTEAGLVEKTRDNTDKRMWRLYPTQKALELYVLIIKEENKNISICYHDLSDEENKSVYGLVKKMKENMENEWRALKNY